MEPNIEETCQLHTKFGKLFGTVTEPNNSPYQNLLDLSFRPSKVQDNPQMFLPPSINPKTATEIKKIDLTTEFRGNQPVLSYTITWLDKNASKKTDKASIKSSTKTRDSQRKSVTSSLSDDSSETDEPVQLVKKPSSMMKIPGKVRCDGPCAQVIELADTVQFGCDHVICSGCRKKATSTPLFDGSPGCCNVNCVQLAKANGDKVCAGQSNSVTSNISYVGAIESIVTHVCILKNYGHDVLRTQVELEFPSSARFSVIIRCLFHYKDLMKNSRFYYSTQKPTCRADILPISLTDTNLRFHNIVDMKSDPILYLIIVGKDIQFFD
ncbi:RING-type domain-containing protein [Caenorhabditis elegans]|uniref:RING-type domain-containing protein n=1 Tax=Caenorhabditis elegans TaxID=6239 RepID=Q6A4J7_CAEEL|nr:RING-type domain-containing protein [Caenorhabditis elegans]CAH10784.1 RING-type domain-containing protein [Caenorhabditis elegans]|eukprot:NP_001023338.1 Uncharacterized protein CELE_R102.10 [Caenorhabditis elegans]